MLSSATRWVIVEKMEPDVDNKYTVHYRNIFQGNRLGFLSEADFFKILFLVVN